MKQFLLSCIIVLLLGCSTGVINVPPTNDAGVTDSEVHSVPSDSVLDAACFGSAGLWKIVYRTNNTDCTHEHRVPNTYTEFKVLGPRSLACGLTATTNAYRGTLCGTTNTCTMKIWTTTTGYYGTQYCEVTDNLLPVFICSYHYSMYFTKIDLP